jgi:hypothetical protein
MFQMVIKYTNIFHSKALQNLPKLGFLVWKQTIWQPCSCVREEMASLIPARIYVRPSDPGSARFRVPV